MHQFVDDEVMRTRLRAALDAILALNPEAMITWLDAQTGTVPARASQSFMIRFGETVSVERGPWVCVDLDNGKKYAIWKLTGNVYEMEGNAVGDDPIVLGLTDDQIINLPVPGTRIALVHMPNDPDPIKEGATGTVRYADRLQIWVDWDEMRSLNLIPGIDKYRVIGRDESLPENKWNPGWTLGPAPIGDDEDEVRQLYDTTMKSRYEMLNPPRTWDELEEWQREAWRRELRDS